MNKRIISIFVILFVFMLVVVAFYPFFLNLIKGGENEKDFFRIEKEIKDYNYKLRSNQTTLYKKYFNELEHLLQKEKIDEDKYAEILAKLFIVDFFTLDNKITKNDIGGTDFVYSLALDDFLIKAKDTVYKYLKNKISASKDEKLPIVKTIEVVSIKNISYKYLDKQDLNAYEIELSWTYKKDLGYQNLGTVIVIHEGEKLSIAEMK